MINLHRCIKGVNTKEVEKLLNTNDNAGTRTKRHKIDIAKFSQRKKHLE